MSLQSEIDQYVRTSFLADDIVSVVVGEPYESYGPLEMMVMDVTVTIKGTPREVAEKEPMGFVSGMRKHLADIGEEAFPMISFRPTLPPSPAQASGSRKTESDHG